MPDFAAVFDDLPVATAVVARRAPAKPTFSAVNSAFCALAGRSAENLVGADVDSVLVGMADAPDAQSGSLQREGWLVDPDGLNVPVLYGMSASSPAGTVVVQIYGPAAPGETERAVRSSEQRLQQLADNVAALIYLKRVDGRYIFANRHYEQILGQPRGRIHGQRDQDLWPSEIAEFYGNADRAVLAAGHAMTFEEPIPTEGGWGMWLSLKFPLYDHDGELYGVGGISTDISDRNRAEAEIREAKEEAERANRAKSEFLSRMSHELRTPLNSILGFGQLLQLAELPSSASAEVDQIVSAGRHLLTLINEVLDISRIESGLHTISVETVACCDPIGEAYEMVRPLAADRDVELVLDLHAAIYRYVLADYQRLKQVLLNLLVNAVKYNRPGGMVTVSARVDEAAGRLRILVTDTGVGIADDDREKVFLPFERLDGSRYDAEGTGLGLALARSFMESMGGSLEIERTVPGRGSVFYVELPLTAAPDADVIAAQAVQGPVAGPDLSGRTILYIEDNLTNFEVVRRIFEQHGDPELLPAPQGRLGIQLAGSRHPDAILLDLHLPDLDGEEVLRQLRADSRTAGIPVVILSADATSAQREWFAESGACDFVTKPIGLQHLLAVVQRALRCGPAR